MSTIFADFVRRNSKKLVIFSAFLVALTGAAALGFATKQFGSAAGVRDTGTNPIFNANANGGIGCLSAKECVADLKQNKEKDIQTIHNHFGLSPSEYTRFEQTAKMGKTFKNGDVYVDNQIVIRGANSMGRNKFNASRQPITIGGKTYYYSSTQNSFADSTNSIDTLVMFDKSGVVESAIMTACGNPVWGNKVKPEYDCKALNKKEVAKDTYDFTTSVHYKNNATVNKVVYDFGDGTPTVTKTNPAEAVRHKYEKSGEFTAKVTVYFNLPGRQVVAVPAVKCLTKITVTPPPAPFYSCTAVLPTALNNERTKYRFTVKTSQGNGATLKDADFTLDTSSTVTGVTTKDSDGNIYKEYEFARDGKDHTVVVKVNFNVANGVQSKSCEAKITAGQEEEKPFYECTALVPSTLNAEMTKFRFTIKTDQGNGATLKDADFTLDGSSTVTGVVTKDEAGNIYKEYEFVRDGKEHTITVKVNFNVAGGVQSKTCAAKVTSGKTPVCVVNGKEYPIGSPECEPYKCPIPGKEDKPKEECNEVLPAELPKTGMGGVLSIFAGTTVLGTVAHRMFASRRNRFDV